VPTTLKDCDELEYENIGMVLYLMYCENDQILELVVTRAIKDIIRGG